MGAPRKTGRVIRVSGHQTGATTIPRDVKRIAMKPGMRISVNDNPYFEGRANRSDKNPKRKL